MIEMYENTQEGFVKDQEPSSGGKNGQSLWEQLKRENIH